MSKRSQAQQDALDKQLQEDVERGAEDFGHQTKSYGLFLIDVLERKDEPKRLKALSRGFGESAKHALRAIELEMIDEDADDAWDIRKAILYARIKDDADARMLFDAAQENAEMSWDDHKAIVRKANGHAAPRKRSPTALLLTEALNLLVKHHDASLDMIRIGTICPVCGDTDIYMRIAAALAKRVTK